MPLEKSKAYVSIEGLGEATLEQMENWFLEELKKEDEAAGDSGFPNSFPDETKAKLDAFHKEMTEMVTELIDTYVTTELMFGTIENTVKHAYINFNPLEASSEGEFGTFLERRLFGARGDDRPTADIDRFRGEVLEMRKAIEVKAKTGSYDITAGGITVYGLPEALTDIELATVHNITMIYKMMIKMQNFLYLNMKKRNVGGHDVLGFYVMTLYTSLYLRALYNVSRGFLPGATYIDVKQPRKTKSNPKPEKRLDKPKYDEHSATYTIPYEIFVAFTKTGVVIKGLERIARLYLRHTNMIDEINSGGVSAAEFFGKLRKIGGWLEMD